jgi:hypothetical protein
MLDLVRKRAVHGKALPLGLHWLMLVIAGALFALVAMFVDLRPVVDENFSFRRAIPVSAKRKRSSTTFRRSRK